MNQTSLWANCPAGKSSRAQRSAVSCIAIIALMGVCHTAQAAPKSSQVPPPDRNVDSPIWVDRGPRILYGGLSETGSITTAKRTVGGTVTVIRPHPTQPDIVYVGTSNGGVWGCFRTIEDTILGDPASPDIVVFPTWAPLTDSFRSLSISALEFDTSDNTYLTLVTGIGRSSSYELRGGPLIGIMITRDGGTTWLPVASQTLVGKSISGLNMRGNTILAGVDRADDNLLTSLGLYRSTDRGATFTRLSGNGSSGLPNGSVSLIATDPLFAATDRSRILAVVQNTENAETGLHENGLYLSIDGGITWRDVSPPDMATLLADSSLANGVRVSVGQENNIWVAINNASQLAGFFRSDDGGLTWEKLLLPSTDEGTEEEPNLLGLQPFPRLGFPGSLTLSLAADYEKPYLAFLGGTRQPGPFTNSIGAVRGNGRLFSYDFRFTGPTEDDPEAPLPYQPITNDFTRSKTAPTPNSRNLMLDASYRLLDGNESGLFRLTDPNLARPGDWFTLNGGNIPPAANDTRSARDGDFNAHEIHTADIDAVTGRLGIAAVGNAFAMSGGSARDFNAIRDGDPGIFVFDDRSLFDSGQTVQYTSRAFLSGFLRTVRESGNGVVLQVPPSLTTTCTPEEGEPGFTLEACDQTIRRYTPVMTNRVQGAWGLIGTNTLYESFDRFNNLDVLIELQGPILAMDYGGKELGVTNPFALWIAGGVGGNEVYYRGSLADEPTKVAYPGGVVRDIVMDPDDWRVLALADGNGDVWRTRDTGTTWLKITGNLKDLAGFTVGTPPQTIEFIRRITANDSLIVGGVGGAYITNTVNLGTWAKLGNNLPSAIVQDLRWDPRPAINTLVAGTMGRGVWTVPNAASATDDLTISASDMVVELVEDPPPARPVVDNQTGVEIGPVRVGSPLSRTFVVRNTSQTIPLTLEDPALTGPFVLTKRIAEVLQPGQSDTFSIAFTESNPQTGTPYTGTVSFGNNDPDTNPFNFDVVVSVNPRDIYEENDTLDAVINAGPLPLNTKIENLNIDDEDWYRVVLPNCENATFEVSDFLNAEGNINLEIYDTRCQQTGFPPRLGESYSLTNGESITYTNNGANDVYVRVYQDSLPANIEQTYSLQINTIGSDDEFEPNSVPLQFRNIATGITYTNLVAKDDDFFRVTTNGADFLTLTVDHQFNLGQLYYQILEDNGGYTVINGGIGAFYEPNLNRMTLSNVFVGNRSSVTVRVFPANRGRNIYSLRIDPSTPGRPIDAPETTIVAGRMIAPARNAFTEQEPNNSCTNAKEMLPAPTDSVSLPVGDEDWYRFTLQASEQLTARFSYIYTSDKDVDVQLFAANCTTKIGFSEGTTNEELIQYTNNTTSPVTLNLRVFGYRQTTDTTYFMNALVGFVDDAFEPNDTFNIVQSATPLRTNVTVSNLALNNVDWYRISLPTCTNARVVINSTQVFPVGATSSNIQAQLYDARCTTNGFLPVRVGEGYSAGNTETILYTNKGVTELFLEVYREAGTPASESYTILVETLTADDQYEPNDGPALTNTTLPLNTVLTDLVSKDEDFYTINTTGLSSITVKLTQDFNLGQLYMQLLQADGSYTVLRGAYVPNLTTQTLTFDLSASPRSAVVLHVYPAGRESNFYGLEVITTAP